jgi:hypothetical protein
MGQVSSETVGPCHLGVTLMSSECSVTVLTDMEIGIN